MTERWQITGWNPTALRMVGRRSEAGVPALGLRLGRGHRTAGDVA
ncbi:hypothetical protein [Actinoalloteichus hymeniacidonis]|nr:hypothetical protein [Actinoalloteichus hymeniacidonis]MBB5908124.1 hypothetical protein [Actinoalloteichus hymeniacidonis]